MLHKIISQYRNIEYREGAHVKGTQRNRLVDRKLRAGCMFVCD